MRMIAPSLVKFSESKPVPHSDLRTGISREEFIIRVNHNILRVGELNVRSLKGRARLENLKREMDKLHLYVVGTNEVRGEDEGNFGREDYRVMKTKAYHRQTGGSRSISEKKNRTEFRTIHKSMNAL